jgi:cytochrome c oxidase subunit 4
MVGPIISTKTLVAVLVALLVLALLTWFLSYVDLRRWNLVLAMAIAVCKMLLVVLVFMHGWFMPRVSKLAFFAGFFWLSILVTLTLSDYVSRDMEPTAAATESP